MSLPVAGAFPARTIRLSGGDVKVRGLSFQETVDCDEGDFTVLSIAAATDTPHAEVKGWLGLVPAGDVKVLMDTIVDLSGLGEGAVFPGGAGDGVGVGGETVDG